MAILLFLLLLLTPSSVMAQYTDSYTDSYTDNYTDSYTNSYTDSYGGGTDNYTTGYQGSYQGSYGSSCGNNCSVSGYVFYDNNRDGVFNSGDTGGFAEPVQLIQPGGSGNVTGSTNTNASGYWTMGGLPPATYGFRHGRLPSGYYRTTPSELTFYVNSHVTNVNFGVAPIPTISQYNPVTSCNGSTPTITLSWTPYFGAARYEVFYMDTVANGAVPPYNMIDTNTYVNGTSHAATSSMGLLPGHSYGFIIAALNSSNQILAYSNSSQWSHQVYGSFTTMPYCSPPGSFNFAAAPAPFCNGTTSTYRISWTPAANAQEYRITPQTNIVAKGTNPPGTGYRNTITLNPPPPIDGSGYINYDYVVPGAVVANEAWEFTIVAHNTAGDTPIPNAPGQPGGSSYYYYGWINALNCTSVPTVNLSITTPTGGPFTAPTTPVFVNQNTSPVNLNWSTVNANSCTASGSWSGNQSTNGSQPINTATPGVYNYILTCSNINGPSTQSIQLEVEQYPKPYFQTRDGDVHSNEDIYITP